MATAANSLEKTRARIGERVRELRRERHWTQEELAGRLDLSQGRYSEIERGKGSFTAEQFLSILKLFNAPLSVFDDSSVDSQTQLQNALARLGADHLKESEDVLPSERLDSVVDAIREALLLGTPRVLTGLAPVLVRNIDEVNLGSVGSLMVQYGLERRLGWLVENTLEAVRSRIAQSPPRPRTRTYKRAEVVLQLFLDFVISNHHGRLFDYPNAPPDILDRGIRTNELLADVRAASSQPSRRWGIVTRLQPRDFEDALRAVDPP
jgi:transcriptional regulator with XRE-family HTH domain